MIREKLEKIFLKIVFINKFKKLMIEPYTYSYEWSFHGGGTPMFFNGDMSPICDINY
jgi:hypothetical protein